MINMIVTAEGSVSHIVVCDLCEKQITNPEEGLVLGKVSKDTDQQTEYSTYHVHKSCCNPDEVEVEGQDGSLPIRGHLFGLLQSLGLTSSDFQKFEQNPQGE